MMRRGNGALHSHDPQDSRCNRGNACRELRIRKSRCIASFTRSLTPQQIAEKLGPAAASGPTSASPLSDVFAGKSIRVVTDNGGPTLAYTFTGTNRLSLAENGGASVNAGYGALTLSNVAFFSHMIPGTQRGYAVAIDQGTNLATVFELWFSGYKDNREVQREIYYGYVEQPGQQAPTARHVTTNRVEGHGFYWKQDAGAETLEFFPSAAYSNFVELSRLGGELSFCGPSDYIKINDDRYIYTRTECEFSGTFTAYVMDLNRIEQVGVRLGFDASDALGILRLPRQRPVAGAARAVRKIRR